VLPDGPAHEGKNSRRGRLATAPSAQANRRSAGEPSIEEAASIAQGQTVSAPMRVGSLPCDALFFLVFSLCDRICPGNDKNQRTELQRLDSNGSNNLDQNLVAILIDP
jgi:hypothetical protein